MIRVRFTAGLAVIYAVLGAGGAAAQVERSGGGENAALMAQYQQALAAQTQLQTDNAKLKQQLDASQKQSQKQLEELKRQVAMLKSGASSSQTALQHAQTASQTYEKSFEDTRTRLLDLVNHFQQTVATMRGIETSRAQLQLQLAQSKAAFNECANRNVELYQVDDEVLKRYEHQGMLNYLERAEPFTRLKRTQIENLVDDYRERGQQLRLPGQSGSAGPAAGGSTGAAATGSGDAAASPSRQRHQ